MAQLTALSRSGLGGAELAGDIHATRQLADVLRHTLTDEGRSAYASPSISTGPPAARRCCATAGGCGPVAWPRYLVWQSAYWASWPSVQGTWAAEQVFIHCAEYVGLPQPH